MPTYEYECRDCGERFDRFQPMSAAALTDCPSCGGSLRRLIGPGSGIIFRGSGFHATDYGSGTTSCDRSASCCGRTTPCGRSPRNA